MSPLYYRRFKMLTRRAGWRRYLRRVYRQSLADLRQAGHRAGFQAVSFTALLCGTGGGVTTALFVEHVRRQNPQARLIILDRSPLPLVDSRAHTTGVAYVQADARRLPFPDRSLDYIETDGFLAFFAATQLPPLFVSWRRVLSATGFITTRAYARRTWRSLPFDWLRWLILWLCVGFKPHLHQAATIDRALAQAGLICAFTGDTGLPNFRRFVILGSPSLSACHSSNDAIQSSSIR